MKGKEKKQRKKTRRNQTKYPALEKKFNLKTRQDFIEADYINGVKDSQGKTVIRALTHEEKDWLNRFNEEVVNANFLHPGKKLYKKKEDKRKIYQENNARNRCLFTRTKACGLLRQIKGNVYDVSKYSEIYLTSDDEIMIETLRSEKRLR